VKKATKIHKSQSSRNKPTLSKQQTTWPESGKACTLQTHSLIHSYTPKETEASNRKK